MLSHQLGLVRGEYLNSFYWLVIPPHHLRYRYINLYVQTEVIGYHTCYIQTKMFLNAAEQHHPSIYAMITGGTSSFVTSLHADGLIQWPIGDAFWGHQWFWWDSSTGRLQCRGWCAFLQYSGYRHHKQCWSTRIVDRMKFCIYSFSTFTFNYMFVVLN